MPVETDLYKILDVEATSTHEEIKKSYRKLALLHHPDRGGDQEMFKKINASYEILSNPKKREIYDKHGKEGIKEGISEEEFSSLFEDLVQNITIFDLFNVFNRTFRKTPSTVHTVQVSLEDLCTRKVMKVAICRNRICDCYKKEKEVKCDACNGNGIKIRIQNFSNLSRQVITPCEVCKGNKTTTPSCKNCTNGIYKDTKNFDIHLTPSTENNHKYLFKEEGNQDKNFLAGDLVLLISYNPHPLFQVKNRDLIFIKEITLKEALCKCDFEIAHPSGRIISISTDEIISPDTVHVVPSGLTEDSKLEIHYKIVFPESLNKKQKEILYKNL